MTKDLAHRKIAILVMDNFEQAELVGPKEALEAAGAQTVIASAKRGYLTAMTHDEHSDRFQVDATFADLDANDFDGVVLPGGVFNADEIRSNEDAQEFVRRIDEKDKPIAVICHGSWLLVSAGLVRGKTMTSWPSLQDDLRNAGAHWVDEEVVVDGNWISSRKPGDIPAFNARLISALAASESYASAS